MLAAIVRRERYGDPRDAIALEVIDVPKPARGQVVVRIMAAGINYNGIWAGLGRPLDVVSHHARNGDTAGFHVPGSDATGIVWAIGEAETELSVGDAVIVSAYREGLRAGLGASPSSDSARLAWGYETNYGGFAQFAVVEASQCHPKPANMTWETAGCFLVTAATAHRQLSGWPPHAMQRDDVVLIWGGAGGLGSMAIQLARHAGARPIAVVSSEERAQFCLGLGATGTIDRRDFDHWGPPPAPTDAPAIARWTESVRAFGRRIYKTLGEHRKPRIVLEHPGRDTIATSLFVCDDQGMVVSCGATTGYLGALDLRYLWTRQKRLQGSQFASRRECTQVIDLVASGEIDPCLSRVLSFEEIGLAHQLMYENRHPPGQMAVLVGSPRPGLAGWPDEWHPDGTRRM
jgi:crotonyl-CoA carboxylase/reductase